MTGIWIGLGLVAAAGAGYVVYRMLPRTTPNPPAVRPPVTEGLRVFEMIMSLRNRATDPARYSDTSVDTSDYGPAYEGSEIDWGQAGTIGQRMPDFSYGPTDDGRVTQ